MFGKSNKSAGASASGVLAATSNFWDPRQYKRIVKRVAHGAVLCDELMKMVEERWVCGVSCDYDL